MELLSWLLLPLLATAAVAQQAERGATPVSPCPFVYSYSWAPGTGWHGVITIIPPARFSEVQLTLRQSLPYYHPEAGVGRVEVKGGDLAIQEISRKAIRGIPQKIQYNVIFPPFRELPKVASIIFNGKDFCPTPQVFSDTKGRIELKYVLKSGLNIPVSSGSAFSVSTDTADTSKPSQTDLLIAGLPPQEARPTEPPPHQGYQPTTTKAPFHQGYQPGTTEPPVEVFVIEFGPPKPHESHNNKPSDSNIGGNTIQDTGIDAQKPFGNDNPFSYLPQKPIIENNQPFLGGDRPSPVHFENTQHVSGIEKPGDSSSPPFTRPVNRPSVVSQQGRPKPSDNNQHVAGTIRPIGSNTQTRPKPTNTVQHVSGTIRPVDTTNQQNRPMPANTGQQHFTGTNRPIDHNQNQQNRPRPVDPSDEQSGDPSQMSTAALDERVVQLLTAISKGETVATSRIEQLLMRLIDLTRKRLDLEVKRLKIEEERLHLEATSV